MRQKIAKKLMQAHRWQSADRLRRIQREQFAGRKARMQWWYFDVLTEDGSVLTLGFVPRKWWPDQEGADLSESFFFVNFLDGGGSNSGFQESFSPELLEWGPEWLRVGEALSIEYQPGPGQGRYSVRFDVSGNSGELIITPTVPPFSAFPRGKLSTLGRRLLLHSPFSPSGFRYVAQCPRGTAEGFVTLGHFTKTLSGWAYHEQGWFNDRPEKLGKGWFWYHFLDPEWNLFGTSRGYLFVQYRDQILVDGMSALRIPYGLREVEYASGDEGKVIAGGTLFLDLLDVRLRLDLSQGSYRPLIMYRSADSGQLWSIAVGAAALTWHGGGIAAQVQGQAILENCWLAP